MLERWQCQDTTNVARVEAIEATSPRQRDQKVQEATIEDGLWICLRVAGCPDAGTAAHVGGLSVDCIGKARDGCGFEESSILTGTIISLLYPLPL